MRELKFLTDCLLAATPDVPEQPLLLRGLPDPASWTLPHLPPGQVPEGLPARSVCLLRGDGVLRLFPLHGYDAVLLWREEEHGFHAVDKPAPLVYLRYNAARGLLEFTALAPNFSLAQRGDAFRDTFLSLFDLAEWRRQKATAEAGKEEAERWHYDFADLMDELTAGLVGRAEHLKEAKKWVHATPGRGRRPVGGRQAGRRQVGLPGGLAQGLRGDGDLCLVPFFFRGGDARCSADHFFQAALYRLGKTLGLAPPDPREPRPVQFARALEAVRRKQAEGARPRAVLLLLDGLDEVAGQHPEFPRLPASLRQPGLLWVCGGRAEEPLAEAFAGADRLWPDGELPPLTAADVRALLLQELDRQRYPLFERDEPDGAGGYRNGFLNELARRSEGLPLYVRLVIEDLRAGRLTTRDEAQLPQGLPAYFERLLDRLRVGNVPQMLTNVLSLLGWSAEPLSEELLREMLRPLYPFGQSWEAELPRVLQYGHVMLRRAPTPEDHPGWALYHESFRQHLQTTGTVSVPREQTHGALLAWCGRWAEHRAPYALRHYADHLRSGSLRGPGGPGSGRGLPAGAGGRAARRTRGAAAHLAGGPAGGDGPGRRGRDGGLQSAARPAAGCDRPGITVGGPARAAWSGPGGWRTWRSRSGASCGTSC